MATQNRSPNADWSIPSGMACNHATCAMSGGKDPQCGCSGWDVPPYYTHVTGSGSIGAFYYDNCGYPINGWCYFYHSAFSLPSGATVSSLAVNRTGGAYGGIMVNGSLYSGDSFSTNPNTSQAWTVADINGSGSHPLQGMACYAGPSYVVSALSLTVTYSEGSTYYKSAGIAATAALSTQERANFREGSSISGTASVSVSAWVRHNYSADVDIDATADLEVDVIKASNYDASTTIAGTASLDVAVDVLHPGGDPYAVTAGPSWVKQTWLSNAG